MKVKITVVAEMFVDKEDFDDQNSEAILDTLRNEDTLEHLENSEIVNVKYEEIT